MDSRFLDSGFKFTKGGGGGWLICFILLDYLLNFFHDFSENSP